MHHPQSQGAVERLNRTIKESLVAISQAMGKPWDEVLQPVTSSYNGKAHGATGMAPQILFALMEPKEDNLDEVERLLAI